MSKKIEESGQDGKIDSFFINCLLSGSCKLRGFSYFDQATFQSRHSDALGITCLFVFLILDIRILEDT